MLRYWQGMASLMLLTLSVVAPGASAVEETQNAIVVSATTLPGAREPQAAVSASGKVFVAYGAKNAIYCSVSADGGRSYTAPVKVAEAGKLSLGMRRGPRIAVVGGTAVITAVYGRQGGGRDGDLLAWRSKDEGKSWQGPITVNDVPGAAREGLHAMAASTTGALASVWLDLRGKGTQILASISRDGGATWEANQVVYRSPDGTVCECCHPSTAYDGTGRLYVMWRNWLGGARDMYLSQSDDGKTFGAAQKLGEGTWPLNACPMDGGGIAVAANGSVTTFWRRNQSLFACAPGETERLIGKGEQGWAAYSANVAYFVWLERRGGMLWAQVAGQPSQILAPVAEDPVVASAPFGKGPVIAVWQEGAGDNTTIRSAALSGRSGGKGNGR